MKEYHINFYLDANLGGPSSGANYDTQGDNESQHAINALTQWNIEFPIDKHPNIKFISMRIIE